MSTFDLRLVVYTPNGARRGVLPVVQDISVSLILGDVGALQFTVADDAPLVSTLLPDYREIALEVTWDGGATWAEPSNARFVMVRRSGDPTAEPTTTTWSGPSYGWLLMTARDLGDGNVWARPYPGHQFYARTPGYILHDLIHDAQLRPAIAGMTYASFSATTDSAGAAWIQTLDYVAYEAGTDYLGIVAALYGQGLIDWETAGRDLRIYDPLRANSGLQTDSGAILFYGRDLSASPYQGSIEGLAYSILMKGDDLVAYTKDTAVLSPWGKWEQFVSASGVKDVLTLTQLSNAYASLASEERVERTADLKLVNASTLPFRDYTVGQTIKTRLSPGDAGASVRVISLTLTKDASGVVGGNVVLNDRFLDSEVRLSRNLTNLTGGGASPTGGSASGTGGTPIATTIGKTSKGVIRRGSRTGTTGFVTAETGYLRLDNVPLQGGRSYRVSATCHLGNSAATGKNRAVLRVAYGATATTASGAIASTQNSQGVAASVESDTLWGTINLDSAGEVVASILLSYAGISGTTRMYDLGLGPAATIVVEDMGQYVGDSGISL